MTGEGLPILVDLVNDGLIRILDLVFVAEGQGVARWALLPSLIWTTTGLSTSPSSKVCCSQGLVSQEDLDHGAGDRSRVVCRHTDFREPVGPHRFLQALRRGKAQLVAAG